MAGASPAPLSVFATTLPPPPPLDGAELNFHGPVRPRQGGYDDRRYDQRLPLLHRATIARRELVCLVQVKQQQPAFDGFNLQRFDLFNRRAVAR